MTHLPPNTTFNMNLSIGYRDDEVAPSVSINGITGEQAESLSIEQEENNSYYINDTVGAVGDAYHFEMNGTFENTATISFEFDSDLLNDEDFDPVIYYFNEEEQELEALSSTPLKFHAQKTGMDTYCIVFQKSDLEKINSALSSPSLKNKTDPPKPKR